MSSLRLIVRTIIAGSRDIKDEDLVFETIRSALEDGFEITEVVSGTAEGVDELGEKWGDQNDVSVSRFPYEDYTDDNPVKVAPLVRNKKMAEYAEQAIIIWDGESPGTENMIEEAKNEGLNLHVNRTDNTDITDFY